MGNHSGAHAVATVSEITILHDSPFDFAALLCGFYSG
jgi:hypothetical protein